MNACGQHMAANIGLHGSSIKKDNKVIPAMQVVIGGGLGPSGNFYTADKVIKLPTKRIPDALRALFDDYDTNSGDIYYNDYYLEKGKRYFYNLLKPFANIDSLEETDFFDWGQDNQYVQQIGVGECAGVSLDVVGTIISEANHKVKLAERTLEETAYAR